MKHVYRLILFCTMMIVYGAQAQTVTIGAGAVAGSTGSNIGVIYRSSATSAFDFSQQYFLYTAAELSAAGIPPGSIITSVAWNKDNAFGTTAGNTTDSWKIYMKNTTTVAAAGWSNTNFTTQSTGATLVYNNASQVIPASIGWVNLNLTTSFIYTGGSLEIGSNWDCSLYSGGPSTGGYAWKRDNISNVCYGSSSTTSTMTLASQTARPQIQISYVPGTPCSGTPTAGTTVSSVSSICPSTPFSVSLTGNTLASGLTYQWQSSTNGSTYTNVSGATNSSYSASQTVDSYYQCIVTCTGSASSSTSTPVFVTTNSFLNCYCTSNATSALYDDIFNVTLGALNNNSNCSTVAGPGSIAAQYSDYTNTSPATTIPFLLQGLNMPMSVTTGTCGTSSLGHILKVFIDYNHNGLFTDAGEEVYVSPSSSSAAHTESFNIMAPVSSLTGLTRMRVVYYYTTIAANVNPCGTYTYGETEDYFVSIAVPLANDAGISSFVTPTLPTCSFSDSVRVSLKNFGTSALTSATIYLSLNGGVPTTFPWTGSIASFASQTVNLGLFALTPGMNLLAYTQLPNGVVESPSGSWNDSSVIANLSAGLSGTKTIGGTAPDYATIAAAITDLATFGVCGPVIFDIRDGVYTEQMNLPSLPSMSAANTVTFRSENANPTLVTITTASSALANNYVVSLAGDNNYHFEKLTLENTGASFSTVFAMGGASMNSVKGCILKAPIASSTSTNNAIIYSNNGVDDNNEFMNNTFIGGSYGMYWYGPSTTSFENGNVIEGNMFDNQSYRGLMIYYNNGVKIKNNTIIGNNAYATKYAVYLYYAVGAVEITGNNIVGSGNNGWYYGIYYSQGGGTSVTNRGTISNNMIQTGWTGATSAFSTVYLTGVGYMDVYHNSLLHTAGSASSYTLYATSGGGIDVKNNILANYTSGYAFYLGNAFTVTNSDYNVLYAPIGNTGYVLGAQSTLANWQSASGFDANSINYNPNFYSNTDLHVCSDSIGNQGTPIAAITNDIDGHSRSTTAPDMGADEYNGIVGSFLGPDVVLCVGDSVQLIAGSPTDTILWSNGLTSSSIWVSAPGTYSVIVNSACGVGTDAIVITSSNLNYAGYMAASNVVFCVGDSVLLTSTQTANSYLWSNGSTNDSIWVTAGGTYTLTITDACGSGIEGLTVTMNNAPVSQFTSVINFFTGSFANTSVSAGATTYLWNFGDGTTSTLMDPVHIYPGTGPYVVTLTVTNACGTSTITNSVNIAMAGLDEVVTPGSVCIYPNPSNGLFNIELELNAELNLNLEVTNVLGKVVSSKTIVGKTGVLNEQIDLSNEAAGVYYVRIKTDAYELVNKMLIKK
jgi:hypothetical protein